MMPVGPLMVEHRLIERMLVQLGREAKRIRATRKVDTDFVLAGIEFIRLYADRCHHGKEEDILFRELKKKPLSDEHRRVMQELEAEHLQGRRTVGRLAMVRERVLKGDTSAVGDLTILLEELVRFYPAHIDKEDRNFFLPCMDYFTEEEQAEMVEEGREFDRALVQTYYENLLDAREGKPQASGASAASLEGPAATSFGCMVCGHTYDPRRGDYTQHIPPGTPYSDLPADWVCPSCHVGKAMFIPLRSS